MASNNKLRIVGGKWRSRSINCLDGPGMRPTPNRVREMLFNWLGNHYYNANVLDAFAGSGALGIEALSRGAASATFFETQKKVYQNLKTNLAALAVDSYQAYQQDFLKFSNHNQQQFELVFLDPPFHQQLLSTSLLHLLGIKALSKGALIYCEYEADLTSLAIPTNLLQLKSKQVGGVVSLLLQY